MNGSTLFCSHNKHLRNEIISIESPGIMIKTLLAPVQAINIFLFNT